jgi:hypothetical protein
MYTGFAFRKTREDKERQPDLDIARSCIEKGDELALSGFEGRLRHVVDQPDMERLTRLSEPAGACAVVMIAI